MYRHLPTEYEFSRLLKAQPSTEDGGQLSKLLVDFIHLTYRLVNCVRLSV